MKRMSRSLLLLVVVVGLILPSQPVVAATPPGACAPDGLQSSGAVYRICMPTAAWNGDLVVYAHGYVAFNEPIAIPEDQLGVAGRPTIPELVNSLGFAFATTSYSTNGLAIRQGLADVVDLVDVFTAQHGAPGRVYLAGPSEGGIITALALEQHPEVFAGGLSACGPVGDFPAQINYWGDVRVLFDYFFAGVLPGSAIEIPQDLIDQWETVYEPIVENELRAHPRKRKELMTVADIPQSANSEDEIDALVNLVWYNVFATNDGLEKLGGQPYDNRARIYRGSEDDVRLNFSVPRYSADPIAREEMETHYQTHAGLVNPIVMLHTVDPIIPLWHELVYELEVEQTQAQRLHTHLPFLERYGHCNFTIAQLLFGFIVLLHEATRSVPAEAEAALATAEQRQEFEALMQDYFAPDQSGVRIFLPAVKHSAP
jgi:hypothetical protein